MNQIQRRRIFQSASKDVALVIPAPLYTDALVQAVNGASSLFVQVKVADNSTANPAPTKFSAKLYPGFFTDDNDVPVRPPADAVPLPPGMIAGAWEAQVPTVNTIVETNSQQTLVVWPNSGEVGVFKLNITDFGNFVGLINIKPVDPVQLNGDGTVGVTLTCADNRVVSIFAKIYPGTIDGEEFPIPKDTGAVLLTQDQVTTTNYTGNVDACAVTAANTARTLVIWPSDDATGANPFTLWYQHILVSP